MKQSMKKNRERLSSLSKMQVKWTAGVTALAVSIGMTGCSAKDIQNIPAVSEKASVVSEKTEEKSLKNAVYSAAKVSEDGENEKEETVYGMMNADGSVNHIIVENWVKNFGKQDSLTVNTDGLNDIVNVNGGETFTEGQGTLTWAAEGNDIYYEGTTQKELPVSMKVTYYLDDKEVKPEELKGKSGRVRIRYEYENLTETTITVDGKNEKVSTPFAVVTGLILPTDTFSNVKAENAEIVSDGSSQIVVGCAFPGLQKSLGISDKDLKEISDDFTIPEYFEVTADAENFSLNMALTVVTNQMFADKKEDMEKLLDKADDMTKDMNDLQDGSSKLVDGTEELDDGAGDLKDGARKLNNGASDLKDGVGDLDDGAKQLKDGAKELDDGAGELNDGAGELKSGASDLKDGAKQLKDGTKELKEGLDTLDEKSSELTEGIDSLKTGVTQYTEGVASLKEGADKLQAGYEGDEGAAAGAKTLAEGAKTLNDTIAGFSLEGEAATAIEASCTEAAKAYLQANGIDPTSAQGAAVMQAFSAGSKAGTDAVSTVLSGTMTQLSEATKQLSDGAAALSTGIQALYEGTTQLSAGITQLNDNSEALTSGTKTLAKGWSQYAEGVASADKGAKTLFAGTKTLYSGTGDLFTGTVSLVDGVKTLKDGTGTLFDGTKDLSDGTKKLKDGVNDLKDGTSELYDGTKDLKDGTEELKDGMAELDEDGIQKLYDVLGDDLSKYTERMRKLLNVAVDYDNFTGRADGMDNSVKFVLKTAEITNEEGEE